MPWKPKRPCRVTSCPELQPCPNHPILGRWDGRRSSAVRGYGWAWQQQRKRALERDGYTCVAECGSLAEHVDHIVAKADGGTDDLANLASLCRAHHLAKTGREGQARR
jgi:5-methylcytosine-specific restriction enzyme A